MITGAIQHAIRGIDSAAARMYLSLFSERKALMCFLFHSLFENEREMRKMLIDPLQRTTVAQFRQFIEYYRRHGYQFITPADVLAGLEPSRKYALISFDDGYYNNVRALPILEEFDVPATFFISTENVRLGRCFWWDVLCRERSRQNVPYDQISHEALGMKSLKTEQIEQRLADEFGPGVFQPVGDVDRPFNPDELRQFASHRLVHIGNHTANHAILTNYDANEVRAQLQTAQDALESMTGERPISIAYPNGGHDDQVVDICRAVGLKVGFTIRPRKCALPAKGDLLRLGRFSTHGESTIVTQCQTYRSDVLVYGMFRDAYLRLVRKQVAQ